MAIELATQFQSKVDELFFTESRHGLITNQDYSWDGAASIKVYSVSTADMNDYGRTGPEPGVWSRYGPIQSLDATTQVMTLRKDRSFTFAVDRLDVDETKQAIAAAAALARQLREVTMPEIDSYMLTQMCENAGQKPAAVALTATNIFERIVDANNLLDNEEVPETNRSLILTPDKYLLLKKSKDVIMETNLSDEQRKRGIIAMIDGLNVIRVPANRLPAKFGFLIAHPIATVAPVKLSEYRIHQNPPGISGDLAEGRFNYDAFVLKNKAKALAYQANT